MVYFAWENNYVLFCCGEIDFGPDACVVFTHFVYMMSMQDLKSQLQELIPEQQVSFDSLYMENICDVDKKKFTEFDYYCYLS